MSDLDFSPLLAEWSAVLCVILDFKCAMPGRALELLNTAQDRS